MTPIYFPHTYVTRSVMEDVQACFSPVVLYQPCAADIPPLLREWEKRGQVELRVPVPTEEEKLATLLTDFRNWAALHRDKRGIDLLIPHQRVHFFNDLEYRRQSRRYVQIVVQAVDKALFDIVEELVEVRIRPTAT
jgi:hypothetical protein